MSLAMLSDKVEDKMPEKIEERIAAVRHFNRFFTRRIGVVSETYLHSPYSLTEARVLYELANQNDLTATDLGRELALDQGYLSRLLARFEQQGVVERERAEGDGRQRLVRLTAAGQTTFATLNQESHDEIAALLAELSDEDQRRLLGAMATIERLFGARPPRSEPLILRSHEPGDMGWVVQRHGALYAQEYHWDERFEALVAQICADFINNYQPARERCWLAELNGELVGSVFVVQASETDAKLRLLLVDPKARGMGLGTRLVQECIRFARRSGYRRLKLWTNSVLVEARHIYEKCGFTLVEQEAHHSFGHDLVGETWVLEL
jgi:DNA-binding MarR family transcriptional regulator/GNAT superfamily N-acetyltransferase